MWPWLVYSTLCKHSVHPACVMFIMWVIVIHWCQMYHQQQCPRDQQREKYGHVSWVDWINSDPTSAGLRVSAQRTSRNGHIWPPAEAQQRENHNLDDSWEDWTDIAPTSVGLRVPVCGTSHTWTTTDCSPSSWLLENCRTMSFSRPTRSETTWPSTTFDGRCGWDWTYTRHLFSVGLGRPKISS